MKQSHVLNRMPWHNAEIPGERAQNGGVRFTGGGLATKRSETSLPSTAVLFDKHIQLEDLLEVSTTTEPTKKDKIKVQVGPCPGSRYV